MGSLTPDVEMPHYTPLLEIHPALLQQGEYIYCASTAHPICYLHCSSNLVDIGCTQKKQGVDRLLQGKSEQLKRLPPEHRHYPVSYHILLTDDERKCFIDPLLQLEDIETALQYVFAMCTGHMPLINRTRTDKNMRLSVYRALVITSSPWFRQVTFFCDDAFATRLAWLCAWLETFAADGVDTQRCGKNSFVRSKWTECLQIRLMHCGRYGGRTLDVLDPLVTEDGLIDKFNNNKYRVSNYQRRLLADLVRWLRGVPP